MKRKASVFRPRIILPALALIALSGYFVYRIPFVQDHLGWRVALLRSRIRNVISPPEEAVFTPDPTLVAMVDSTLAALSPTPTTTPTLGPTATQAPSATPTIPPTAIPSKVLLTGVVHEYQKFNNCGPANLAMALSYWGWQGDQTVTAAYMKPYQPDKNVMPYEMAAFIQDKTSFDIVVRAGGDLQLLKSLLAAGFPVIIEKGFDVPNLKWMGHYQLVVGYDDGASQFTTYDSYEGGPNLKVGYDKFETYWRHFNYTYLVIYPPERENEVASILGPQMDEVYNEQYAAQLASDEIFSTTGRDNYFAWFNRGTNLVALQDYAGAANAYDQAFDVYASLDPDLRPYRMLWYQTGPYWAYFYTGRYYDVINLATQTLTQTMDEPIHEESYYWRGLAEEALGDLDGAIADWRTALEYHPNWDPALAQLNRVGAQP